MSDYKNVIEEGIKQLEVLLQEREKIETDYDLLDNERIKLQEEAHVLNKEIEFLEEIISNRDNAPKYFRRIKLKKIVLFVVTDVLVILGSELLGMMADGKFKISLDTILIGSLLSTSLPLITYFTDTHKRRYEIETIDFQIVEEFIDDKKQNVNEINGKCKILTEKIDFLDNKLESKVNEILDLLQTIPDGSVEIDDDIKQMVEYLMERYLDDNTESLENTTEKNGLKVKKKNF